MSSKGILLQQAVQARLESDGFFSDIEILLEDVHDIENEIERSVQKATGGVCVIVLTTKLNTSGNFAQVTAPYWDRVEVVVQVVEYPTINRADSGTGKPAIEVAENVARLLCLPFKPDPATAPFTPLDPTLTLVPDETFVVWNCRFRTAGAIVSPVLTTTPVISEALGVVSIASEPGAAVFFTTNGSRPTWDSTLYSVPIAPGAGTVVKARAFYPNKQPSAIASYTVLANGTILVPSPGNSLVTGPSYLIADGTTGQIVVTINDQNGDPMEDRVVSLAADSVNVTIQDATLLTNSSGQVSFAVSSMTADETVEFTATDITNGGSVEVTDTHSLDFIPLGEPYPSLDTEALFHFDGSDGSQDIEEEKGATVSVFNTAQISVDNPIQYHGQNLYIDENNGFLTIPWTFNPGSAGEFTVAWWQWLDPSAEHGSYPIKLLGPTGLYYGMEAGWVHRNDNKVSVYIGDNWNVAANRTIQQPIVNGVWAHMAITKAGSAWKTFLNGAIASQWSSGNDPLFSTGHNLKIAGSGYLGAKWRGRLDEVILANKAIWTAPFTVPTLPWTLT